MNISSHLSQITASDRWIAGTFSGSHASYKMSFMGLSYPNDHTTHLNYRLSNLQSREIDIVLDSDMNVFEIVGTKLTSNEANALRDQGIHVPQFWIGM